jgi:ubiquinone/menaquinone biosynthesis C-methylase UbiE
MPNAKKIPREKAASHSTPLMIRLLQLPGGETLAVTLKKLRQKIRSPIYNPYQLEEGFYVVPKSSVASSGGNSGLPIPPKDLWHNQRITLEYYLNSGKENVSKMLKISQSDEFSLNNGNRILDFGCEVGRMIRWLVDLAEECEIWGVEINAHYTIWCQQNLSPPFNFATTTTIPCLPFEDRYFDFIYCGSVFTHIDYLADAWLVELKRITRPGGRIYITLLDKHVIDLTLNQDRGLPEIKEALLFWESKKHFLGSKYDMFSMFPGTPNALVFYDIDYLRDRWGRILNVISVTQEAYFYQTAILLEK